MNANRLICTVLVGGAAVLSGSLPVPAQEVPSAEAIERTARVFTELDPEIKAIEMRSAFGETRLLYRYESPDQYLLLVARAEDRAAYVAVGENKTIIYDVRRGSILLVQGVVPIVRIQKRDGSLWWSWEFKGMNKTSTEPTATLLVDFPSLLQSPNVRGREVESLGGGKHRLTHTFESGRMIATFDPLSPFAFTSLEGHAKGRQVFALDLRVNEQVPPLAFAMPRIETLRARFKVEQTHPDNFKALMRILQVIYLPLGFGAGSDSQSSRDQLDKMFGEKLDWRAMEARYKRDLPKLRQLLPIPQ